MCGKIISANHFTVLNTLNLRPSCSRALHFLDGSPLKNHKGNISTEFLESVNLEKSYFSSLTYLGNTSFKQLVLNHNFSSRKALSHTWQLYIIYYIFTFAVSTVL